MLQARNRHQEIGLQKKQTKFRGAESKFSPGSREREAKQISHTRKAPGTLWTEDTHGKLSSGTHKGKQADLNTLGGWR